MRKSDETQTPMEQNAPLEEEAPKKESLKHKIKHAWRMYHRYGTLTPPEDPYAAEYEAMISDPEYVFTIDKPGIHWDLFRPKDLGPQHALTLEYRMESIEKSNHRAHVRWLKFLPTLLGVICTFLGMFLCWFSGTTWVQIVVLILVALSIVGNVVGFFLRPNEAINQVIQLINIFCLFMDYMLLRWLWMS